MHNVNPSPVSAAYTDIAARKRLGLILLSSDLTTEPEYARVMPLENVAFYSSRLQFDNPLTPENIRKMAPRLSTAAALLPDDDAPAAICYSCTSASVVLGDEAVQAAVHKVWPEVPVVTPSYSAVRAFRALGVSRISVLTPYLVETSLPMADYFTQQGLAILRFDCLGIADDRLMARVSDDSIIAAACAADHPDSEALFISCTALPALGVIATLEDKLGKPVVTSNQATAWAMLQYAGVTERPAGYGQLFEHDFAPT